MVSNLSFYAVCLTDSLVYTTYATFIDYMVDFYKQR